MPTFVHNAFNKSALLTIPSVRLLVRTALRPTVMRNDCEEYGPPRLALPTSEQMRDALESTGRRLANRDWRRLREALVNLNLEDPVSVYRWLGSAGYVPLEILAEPNAAYFSEQDVLRISTENLGWTADYVTEERRLWLKRYRDVFSWLMTLEIKRFREAIKAASEFEKDEVETVKTTAHSILRTGTRPNLKDPGVMFMKETGAPPELDPHTLGLALRGSAISESLPAKFSWDCEGRPAVVVYADSPIAAICLSIHIDRNLSSRGWVRCARCGKWLDRIRGRDRFCSKECRNYVTTTERRDKIKLLVNSEEDWEKLPPKSKKKQTRWRWIAARVRQKSEGKFEITPSWAKQELSKLRIRTLRRPRRDPDFGRRTQCHS